MWRKPTYHWWALTSLLALAVGGLLPVLMFVLPAAQASPNYDNQNPQTTGCISGAENVSSTDSITFNEFQATVQVQSSSGCPFGLWVKVAATSTNGQYKAVVSLTRSSPAGSVTQEAVIGSAPFLSNMLGDENACVTVKVVIESLDGETTSTSEDELCNQGFPATTSTETTGTTGTTGTTETSETVETTESTETMPPTGTTQATGSTQSTTSTETSTTSTQPITSTQSTTTTTSTGTTSTPTQTSTISTSAGPGTMTTTTVTTTSSGSRWIVRTEEKVTTKGGMVVSKSVRRCKHHRRHRKLKCTKQRWHIKPKRKG